MELHERKYDWYSSLVDLIDRYYLTQFNYGTFDCALWGADAWRVQLKDGYDIAARFRGKYDSLKSGLMLVYTHGYSSYVNVFESELPEIPASMAQSGDLVVVEGIGGMKSIGVVVKNIIYAPTERSLGIMPFSKGQRAFAVGRLDNG